MSFRKELAKTFISTIVVKAADDITALFRTSKWNSCIFKGIRQSDDELVYEERIVSEGITLWWDRREVYYSTDDDEIITAVDVEDLCKDGTGGHVEILGGGPGKNYVHISLTSQYNKGMAFDVRIYAE